MTPPRPPQKPIVCANCQTEHAAVVVRGGLPRACRRCGEWLLTVDDRRFLRTLKIKAD